MSDEHKIVVDLTIGPQHFRGLERLSPPPGGAQPWVILLFLNSLTAVALAVLVWLRRLGIIGG